MHLRQHDMPLGRSAMLLHVPVPIPVNRNHKDGFELALDEMEHIARMTEGFERAASGRDTLEYLFAVFGALIDFGNRLRPTFPYAPEMVTLTDKDFSSVEFVRGRK